MVTESSAYAARLNIDYPETLDRLTTFFRLIWIIPIAVIISLISAGWSSTYEVVTESGETVEVVTRTGGGVASGLFLATALMIVFRTKYPRWWFDFSRELTRFGTRVGAYLALLTDQYPSTDEEQAVHLEIDYPNVEAELNRFLPLVKWLLAIPHYIVVGIFGAGMGWSGAWAGRGDWNDWGDWGWGGWGGGLIGVLVLFAAIALLFTARYPRGIFDFVMGMNRWSYRVLAYVALMRDEYPPFRLDPGPRERGEAVPAPR